MPHISRKLTARLIYTFFHFVFELQDAEHAFQIKKIQNLGPCTKKVG